MSRVLIEEVGREPAQVALWDDYVSAHPSGTVYHLSAWRTIFEASFGYRSWLLMAREAATGRPLGALPVFLVPTPFSSRLVCVPFRDRGGPLWEEDAAFEALVAEAKAIARRAGAAAVRLKTVHPYPAHLRDAGALHEHFHWVHSVVDLRGLAPEVLWRRIGDKNRNMVRQAERAGLVFGPIALDAAGVREWHRLHLETQGRLGLPPFPGRFFQVMCDTLAPRGALAMFGVRSGASLQAATIVFVHGRTAIYAYSASSDAGQRHRANDLMILNLARWAIAAGCEHFDLGSDSPAQESLLFFKRKWLATQSPVPIYTTAGADRPVVDSSEPRYRLARRALALLPRGALDAAGSVITRYFG